MWLEVELNINFDISFDINLNVVFDVNINISFDINFNIVLRDVTLQECSIKEPSLS